MLSSYLINFISYMHTIDSFFISNNIICGCLLYQYTYQQLMAILPTLMSAVDSNYINTNVIVDSYLINTNIFSS